MLKGDNGSNKKTNELLLWFDKVGIKDIARVGGKNASLGEMIRHLTGMGIKVPEGFAVTTDSFRAFVAHNDLEDKVDDMVKDLDTDNPAEVAEGGKKIRQLFLDSDFPPDLRREIEYGYWELGRRLSIPNPSVAIRSSATSEDLDGASFAGQHETILNVRGELKVLDAIKQCFASLFTDRAIAYRCHKGFGQTGNALSVGVQRMVRSDLACSGVMFTLDTESGFDGVVYITGAWGLGETIVQGAVNPDQFYVFKEAIDKFEDPIIEKKLGSKTHKLIYTSKGHEDVEVPERDRQRFVLEDDEIVKLAKWACAIEDHYKKAMDIEWAKDGITGELYIVQARPETFHAVKSQSVLETYVLEGRSDVLVKGEPVGSKIGQGVVRVLESVYEISEFKKGEVLVTDKTDPDWEPIMRIASAIVADRGGRTCHAAIVSRELGIPCIIGTGNGTKLIKTGQKVTIDCSEGQGLVYDGILKFRVDKTNISNLPNTRTKIMMNVGVPEHVFTQGQIPCDGVGLARLEFIIASHIGIHPLALIEFDKLRKKAESDPEIAKIVDAIEEKTPGYEDKEDFFVEKLAWGVGKIAATFHPRDVIVRLSDFKTNEYASLLGGTLYEPTEANPMLGWRGASRYYSGHFKEAFRLECLALRRVRDKKGLTNVKVMVPFCRTPEEGRKVVHTMTEFGLKQHENGLEIYMMAEIPSNVVLADEFAEVFDGFSIGSNDLTQLMLGLDRDSELVSHLYNERNPAVKHMIQTVIERVKKKGRKIGICGQAPSDFPDFAEFLVECGIDSISLNTDSVIKTRLIVAEKEKTLGIRP
ncbi:MAG: phosphoenolpyruvate synthase [Euryarchaeota archaeon RBG_13_57_23]|nr:MAG: phosphoenolpyruvate synthase [Euryarchaeota archaeon RBG_13_57_23]